MRVEIAIWAFGFAEWVVNVYGEVVIAFHNFLLVIIKESEALRDNLRIDRHVVNKFTPQDDDLISLSKMHTNYC